MITKDTTRRTRRAIASGIVLTLFAMATATPAAAQEDTPRYGPAAVEERTPPRSFGLGLGLIGGGFSGFTANRPIGGRSSGGGPALAFGTLEIQGFLTDDELSLDLTIPVGNMVATSVELDGFVWNSDLFLNFNIGKDVTRFVLGPGLGFSVLSFGDDTAATVRLPAQLGLELLTDRAGAGIKFLARPWAELGFVDVNGSSARELGGGAIALLVVSGYGT